MARALPATRSRQIFEFVLVQIQNALCDLAGKDMVQSAILQLIKGGHGSGLTNSRSTPPEASGAAQSTADGNELGSGRSGGQGVPRSTTIPDQMAPPRPGPGTSGTPPPHQATTTRGSGAGGSGSGGGGSSSNQELAHAAFCTDQRCEQPNCKALKAKLQWLRDHAASCSEQNCTPCKIWMSLRRRGAVEPAVLPNVDTASSSTAGGGSGAEGPARPPAAAPEASALGSTSAIRKARRDLIAHTFTCLQPTCDYPQCGALRHKLHSIVSHSETCAQNNCDLCRIWQVYNFHLRQACAVQQERFCGGGLDAHPLGQMAASQAMLRADSRASGRSEDGSSGHGGHSAPAAAAGGDDRFERGLKRPRGAESALSSTLGDAYAFGLSGSGLGGGMGGVGGMGSGEMSGGLSSRMAQAMLSAQGMVDPLGGSLRDVMGGARGLDGGLSHLNTILSPFDRHGPVGLGLGGSLGLNGSSSHAGHANGGRGAGGGGPQLGPGADHDGSARLQFMANAGIGLGGRGGSSYERSAQEASSQRKTSSAMEGGGKRPRGHASRSGDRNDGGRGGHQAALGEMNFAVGSGGMFDPFADVEVNGEEGLSMEGFDELIGDDKEEDAVQYAADVDIAAVKAAMLENKVPLEHSDSRLSEIGASDFAADILG